MVKEILDKEKDKNQKPSLPSPPIAPGMVMYDQGYIYFSDTFDSQTTKPVISTIIEKNLLPQKLRPNEITLIINSPGGDVHSAFALIDTIKGSVIPVKTIGLGLIASCGLLLFMSGHKGRRVLTPNTSILSHQYSWGSAGKEHELYARVREFEMSSKRLLDHYKKCTGLTEKKIRQLLLPPEDVWLSAKEAVKHGIADKIVKTY
jgi:ATP-dependent Clp protease protease subunit